MIVTAHTPNDYAVFERFFTEHEGRAPDIGVRLFGSMVSGKLRAVIWLNSFHKRTCYLHATGPITHELIRSVFHYLFTDCGLVQLFAPVAADNAGLLKLMKRLNFEEVCRVENGWTDRTDLVLLALNRARHCRWARWACERLAA